MKVMKYVHQSLSLAGFVILDAEVAATLRPDLWHSGLEAGGDLGMAYHHNRLAVLRGVTRMTVTLTGYPVTELTHELPAAKSPDTRAADHSRKIQDDKIERLRALANQEPPSHDCHLRKEILNARAELERLSA